MPDAPVRLGVQYLGERLVHPAALQQARALAHRRTDQRVAEAHAMHVKVDDPGLGRRFEQINPQRASGNRARSLEDLVEALIVAVRSDQQEQPSRLRQIGHPGSEGLLEPLRERQRAGRDWLKPCRGDRQLRQGQRIAGRLAQQPVTNHRGQRRLRRRVQQRHRIGGRKTAEAMLRQSGVNEQ